jgi:exosortase/archaeosortase family protein
MYNTGGRTGAGLATGAAGASTGAGLAFTGFPTIGLTILALLVIIAGLLLVRIAMLRRSAAEGRDRSDDDDRRGGPRSFGGGSSGGRHFADGARARTVGSRGLARVRTVGGHLARTAPVLRRAVAVLALGAGLFLLVWQSHVRLFEAALAADLLRWTHIANAHPLGSSVVFMHGHRWIGFTVATSCTAALLIAPFYIVGSVLLLPRRLRIKRVIFALGAVSAIVWVANQVRLLLIGTSMSAWGFNAGYSRSHILAGGVISTLGLAIGIAAYVGLLIHQRPGSKTGPIPQGGIK